MTRTLGLPATTAWHSSDNQQYPHDTPLAAGTTYHTQQVFPHDVGFILHLAKIHTPSGQPATQQATPTEATADGTGHGVTPTLEELAALAREETPMPHDSVQETRKAPGACAASASTPCG